MLGAGMSRRIVIGHWPMCDVAARCPTCRRDLAAYETECRDLPFGWTHRYECPCGADVTVDMPAPGLVVTRQDATVED